jgi:hypothetical protein
LELQWIEGTWGSPCEYYLADCTIILFFIDVVEVFMEETNEYYNNIQLTTKWRQTITTSWRDCSEDAYFWLLSQKWGAVIGYRSALEQPHNHAIGVFMYWGVCIFVTIGINLSRLLETRTTDFGKQDFSSTCSMALW